jgi:hypothetical protein
VVMCSSAAIAPVAVKAAAKVRSRRFMSERR